MCVYPKGVDMYNVVQNNVYYIGIYLYGSAIRLRWQDTQSKKMSKISRPFRSSFAIFVIASSISILWHFLVEPHHHYSIKYKIIYFFFLCFHIMYDAVKCENATKNNNDIITKCIFEFTCFLFVFFFRYGHNILYTHHWSIVRNLWFTEANMFFFSSVTSTGGIMEITRRQCKINWVALITHILTGWHALVLYENGFPQCCAKGGVSTVTFVFVVNNLSQWNIVCLLITKNDFKYHKWNILHNYVGMYSIYTLWKNNSKIIS